ncbi:MAG: glycosyltransferase family 2 protein [Verrucomicrobia bacterium]|nr:glycosyltransferase family 2 protein [Verrucomicrobiota bacterium]
MHMLTTVVPVYNGERYLPATLQCLAAQTRRPDRVIILDNCSTDQTRSIVQNFSGLKCEWRQHERNIGLLANLNFGLKFAAETQVLHLLMADDLVKPAFYEKSMATLEPVPGHSMAYSFHEDIDVAGAVIGPAIRRPAGPARTVPKTDFLGRQAELTTMLLPGVIFKTDYQPPVCEFREFPQVADCLFLAEWAARCRQIVEVPEYLCQYRLHPFNATSANIHNLQSWLLDEWRVMQMVLPWIEESAVNHWLRARKLECLFAARSWVKVDMMRRVKPEYAREIQATMRQTVGAIPAMLGWLALRGRDALWRLQGRETKAETLLKAGIQ